MSNTSKNKKMINKANLRKWKYRSQKKDQTQDIKAKRKEEYQIQMIALTLHKILEEKEKEIRKRRSQETDKSRGKDRDLGKKKLKRPKIEIGLDRRIKKGKIGIISKRYKSHLKRFHKLSTSNSHFLFMKSFF